MTGRKMLPETLGDIRDVILRHRTTGDGFDLVVEGRTGDGPEDTRRLRDYARAGATWWVETLGWWRGGRDDALRRIEAGPA
jgi:hypothetical protein